MLWKKESNRPNALYVNIFAREERNASDRLRFKPMPSKNEAVSLRARKEGNRLFGANEWLAAMEKYNQSLRFANRDSENITLAYANRSACFFRLELLNECLADIELAKKAGYPDHLMPKLDKRSKECLKRIEQGASDDFGLKLTLDPNETFPSMANALEFQRGADGSYSVFAKEDIAAGQTIVVEKAFSTFLHQQFGSGCYTCLKANCNLIPCEDCTDAMFCSKECQERLHHKYECNSRIVDNDGEINNTAMHNMRLNLQIINMFPTADELMGFVETAIKSDRNELPDNLTDEKSRLRAFIQFPYEKTNISKMDQLDAHNMCALMRTISKIGSMFTSEKHKRFLMHLIMMNNLISNRHINGCLIRDDGQNVTHVSSYMCLVGRYFKHSCAPNVYWADRDGCTVYITIQPVKKGDQMSFNALHDHFLSLSKEERHKMLGFTCICSWCQGVSATPKERQQLASNSDYRQLLASFSVRINDTKSLVAMADSCATFLNEHGHIKWCDEIKKIVSAHAALISFRFKSQFKLNAKVSIDISALGY